MAQYKVPQDVEADDKLLGPFSFRQFIYLLIAGGLVLVAILLFQIFPLLAVIPLPFIFFLVILALPLKKDQPMETYLAAVISYYLKPHNRFWMPGQRESTILITAPKLVEKPLARDISQEEALHRLSFLSEVIDSEGHSIKNSASPIRDEFAAEANNTPDMFDNANSVNLDHMITQETTNQHQAIVNQMREAIEHSNPIHTTEPTPPTIQKHNFHETPPTIQPSPQPSPQPKPPETPSPNPPKSSIIELANNPDLTVNTIAKQANRINKQTKKDEVYIALH